MKKFMKLFIVFLMSLMCLSCSKNINITHIKKNLKIETSYTSPCIIDNEYEFRELKEKFALDNKFNSSFFQNNSVVYLAFKGDPHYKYKYQNYEINGFNLVINLSSKKHDEQLIYNYLFIGISQKELVNVSDIYVKINDKLI